MQTALCKTQNLYSQTNSLFFQNESSYPYYNMQYKIVKSSTQHCVNWPLRNLFLILAGTFSKHLCSGAVNNSSWASKCCPPSFVKIHNVHVPRCPQKVFLHPLYPCDVPSPFLFGPMPRAVELRTCDDLARAAWSRSRYGATPPCYKIWFYE